jgi:putative SOS response-associated peptidase YedK
MCGRAILTSPVEDIAEAFGVSQIPLGPPRFNIAPTQPLAIVRSGPDRPRELALVRWGLVPWWAKDPKIGNRFIQARAETVVTTPAYRDAFKSKRCLVVVDGFYEWSGDKKKGDRQAHLIRLAEGGPFAIAGLWDSWKTPAGDRMETGAVVTTASRGPLDAVHDRMPLVLDEEARERWLTATPEVARELLDAPSPLELVVVPVSSWVNDARHDDARCLEPG